MRPRAVAAALGAVVLTALTGCLTSTQATRLQKDLDDVKKHIFELRQESSATRSRIEAIAASAPSPQAAADQAGMREDVRSLVDQARALSQRLEQIDGRITALMQQVASIRAGDGRSSKGSGASVPSAGSPPSPAEQDLKTAYADYSKGNYDLALMGFTGFLEAHRGQPAAQEAQYWIGECLYSQRRYPEAAEAFGKAAADWPSGGRTPAALLKQGLAQIEAGQASQGILTLQRLIGAHPQADEAGVAAERLRQLGLRSPTPGGSG